MPAYHFTFHAYRSWNTDHPRGWVQHGERGVQRPSRELARYRDRLANHPEVRFTADQQRAIVLYIREVCGRREWQPYAISADATHVHVAIGWAYDERMEKVRDTIKRLVGYLLAQAARTRGKPWFSHGSDEMPVMSKRHLRYLSMNICRRIWEHFGGRSWSSLLARRDPVCASVRARAFPGGAQ